jgi:hypothetical protein
VNIDKINQAIRLVRDGLASGDLPMHNFDMNHWTYSAGSPEQVHCGTVACIGGWAWLALKHAGLAAEAAYVVGNDSQERPRSMLHLFHVYPKRTITAQDAVAAIDNYLSGSDDPWFAPPPPSGAA